MKWDRRWDQRVCDTRGEEIAFVEDCPETLRKGLPRPSATRSSRPIACS
jgi:hypothetical protein